MILRRTNIHRGHYAVEFAIVAPLFLMLVFAFILGGILIFNYQQMAALSREGARWASVHGYDYRFEKDQADGNAYNTTPVITATDVYNNAIGPKTTTLNTTNVNNGGPLNVTLTV